jgi:hypothetical protein
MKKFALVLSGIGISLLFSSWVVLADDGAIQTMARITMSLNHFPSDGDKAELQGIIDSDDATEDEADIAMALVNFEHKVMDGDTERLADIVNDDSAGADVRKLASIVLHINHAPSDEDKAALAALTEE